MWESGAKWETINSLSVSSRIFHLQVGRSLNLPHWCVVGAICKLLQSSSTQWSKEEEEERSVSPLPSTPLRTRQCAPSLVPSSTLHQKAHPLLYPTKLANSTHPLSPLFHEKTSPHGAHFSLITLQPIIWSAWGHSSSCDGSLHYWNTRPGAPCVLYAIVLKLYTSNWNGTQTSIQAGTRNIMKSWPTTVYTETQMVTTVAGDIKFDLTAGVQHLELVPPSPDTAWNTRSIINIAVATLIVTRHKRSTNVPEVLFLLSLGSCIPLVWWELASPRSCDVNSSGLNKREIFHKVELSGTDTL